MRSCLFIRELVQWVSTSCGRVVPEESNGYPLSSVFFEREAVPTAVDEAAGTKPGTVTRRPDGGASSSLVLAAIALPALVALATGSSTAWWVFVGMLPVLGVYLAVLFYARRVRAEREINVAFFGGQGEAGRGLEECSCQGRHTWTKSAPDGPTQAGTGLVEPTLSWFAQPTTPPMLGKAGVALQAKMLSKRALSPVLFSFPCMKATLGSSSPCLTGGRRLYRSSR